MKTDRTRDLLAHMAKRAVANGFPLETLLEGLKPEYVGRAKALYEEALAQKERRTCGT